MLLADPPSNRDSSEIYRYFFQRPVGIVPTTIYWHAKCIRPPRLPRQWNSYQWENYRQTMFEHLQLPHYDLLPEIFTKTWITKATEDEVRSMEALEPTDFLGVWKLPDIVDEKSGVRIHRELDHRGGCCTEIINSVEIVSTSLYGTELLRTNKQIMDEATSDLYGENKFVFDTRCHRNYTRDETLIENQDLNTDLLPSASQAQIETALEQMFQKNMTKSKLVERDPLMKFFAMIGRQNTSKIRKVQIEGYFRTVWEEDDGSILSRPVGLGQILPIHTTILGNICLNLQQLTLFQDDDSYDGHYPLWSEDLRNETGLSDEERIENIVANLVTALPSLQQLRLEHEHQEKKVDHVGPDVEENPWGNSMHWESVVLETYRKNKRDLVADNSGPKGTRENK